MKKKTRRFFSFLQLLISATLLFFVVFKYNISLFNFSQKLPEPLWLLLSLLITLILIPFLAAFRWKIFLKASGVSENVFNLMKINFISVFWGIFLPSADGFAAIRIYLIEKKYPDFAGKTGSSVIVEKLFGFILLCLWGIVGTFMLPKTIKTDFIKIMLFSLFFVLLLILFCLSNKRIYNFLAPLSDKLKFGGKISLYLKKLHLALTEFPYKKTVIFTLPIMITFQFLTILNVFFIFKASGQDLPLFYHLTFVPTIFIISLIPVSISGFGVRETAFVYFYRLLGISATISFKVSILNFLILSGIPAFIGGIISILEQIRKNDFFINRNSRV